jgi:hypothetical protein
MNHPMNTYIQDRMIIDAQQVISLAEQQSKLEHSGLQGRFRELLVDGILEPWLPPTVQCATGTVIAFNNTFRSKTQEDILLIDRSISPTVLLKAQAQEGVYFRNSVLARIEVKSTLEVKHVRDYQKSCQEYSNIPLDLDEERYNYMINLENEDKKNNDKKNEDKKIKVINILFAFKSKAMKKTCFKWFSSTTDPSISAVCILNRGFWMKTKIGDWSEYQCQLTDTAQMEAERLAAFVGLMSNTAFNQHMALQGRDRLSSLESGIGHYFNPGWNH